VFRWRLRGFVMREIQRMWIIVLFCRLNLSGICRYCDVELGGWEESDDPRYS
jgi:hypothetical protein